MEAHRSRCSSGMLARCLVLPHSCTSASKSTAHALLASLVLVQHSDTMPDPEKSSRSVSGGGREAACPLASCDHCPPGGVQDAGGLWKGTSVGRACSSCDERGCMWGGMWGGGGDQPRSGKTRRRPLGGAGGRPRSRPSYPRTRQRAREAPFPHSEHTAGAIPDSRDSGFEPQTSTKTETVKN